MNKNLPLDYLNKSYFVLGQSQIHVTTLTWGMKFSSTLAWYVLYFTQYKVQPFMLCPTKILLTHTPSY